MIKLIYYLVPAMVITLFVLIMNAGEYLKEARGEHDNVPKYFQLVEADVAAGQWTTAEEDLDKLKAAWQVVMGRIQFDVERDEINHLSANLARLGGSIKAKNMSSAVVELAEAKEHWDELEK